MKICGKTNTRKRCFCQGARKVLFNLNCYRFRDTNNKHRNLDRLYNIIWCGRYTKVWALSLEMSFVYSADPDGMIIGDR